MATKTLSSDPSKVGELLLSWYDEHKRDFPWRVSSGELVVPYHIWLSEVMLQQTVTTTVVPYFVNFIERWPKVEDLAREKLDSILHAWQGLGYYARARNLHKCSNLVVTEWKGQFPQTDKELLTLPGIGEYTASAIAAIAFNQPRIPIDGNVKRIISRLYSVPMPSLRASSIIKALISNILPLHRFGDFAQAMMDIGATVCKPQKPRCGICPLVLECQAYRDGSWAQFPAKSPRKVKPVRYGVVFWIVRQDGAVLLRRRPESGLLGGMIEFSSTVWRQEEWTNKEALKLRPLIFKWREIKGTINHTFTHFHLKLRIIFGEINREAVPNEFWVKPEEFAKFAFPSVMKKIATHISKHS